MHWRKYKIPVTLVQLDSIYQAVTGETVSVHLPEKDAVKQDNVELLEYYRGGLLTARTVDTLNLQLIADNGHFLMRSLKLGKALNLLQYGSKIGLSGEKAVRYAEYGDEQNLSLWPYNKEQNLTAAGI